MHQIASVVCCRCKPCRSNLPLKTEVPRLTVRNSCIRPLGVKLAIRREWRVPVDGIREDISSWDVTPRIFQSACRCGQVCAISPRRLSRVRFAKISRNVNVRERVGRTDGNLAITLHIPSQSDAGGKVQPL